MKNLFLVYYVIVPFLVFVGVVGNLMGLVAFTFKKLKSIRIKCIYKCLFLVNLGHFFKIISEMTGITLLRPCRYSYYLSYSYENLSSMLLVYILLERLVIRKRCILRQPKSQLIYIVFLIGYNFIFYSPFLFFPTKDDSADCQFNDSAIESILNQMDLVNRAIVPYSLLAIMSMILISKSIGNKMPKKTQTSILLSLSYLLLALPLSVMLSLDAEVSYFGDFVLHLAFFLYYSSFGVDFFVIWVFNSKFRQEFLGQRNNKPSFV